MSTPSSRIRSVLVLLSVLAGVAVAVGSHFLWLQPSGGDGDTAVTMPDRNSDRTLRRAVPDSTAPSPSDAEPAPAEPTTRAARPAAGTGPATEEGATTSATRSPSAAQPTRPQPASPSARETQDRRAPAAPAQENTPPEQRTTSSPPRPAGAGMPAQGREPETSAGPSTTTSSPERTDSPTSELARGVNRERAANGCAPVRVDSTLTSAAQAHSDDMATHRRLSHESSDGTSFAERVESYGYPDPAAENVAMGLSSADAVLESWMTSETHRDNILDCEVTAIGVGVNSDGWYWTLDLGY